MVTVASLPQSLLATLFIYHIQLPYEERLHGEKRRFIGRTLNLLLLDSNVIRGRNGAVYVTFPAHFEELRGKERFGMFCFCVGVCWGGGMGVLYSVGSTVVRRVVCATFSFVF